MQGWTSRSSPEAVPGCHSASSISLPRVTTCAPMCWLDWPPILNPSRPNTFTTNRAAACSKPFAPQPEYILTRTERALDGLSPARDRHRHWRSRLHRRAGRGRLRQSPDVARRPASRPTRRARHRRACTGRGRRTARPRLSRAGRHRPRHGFHPRAGSGVAPRVAGRRLVYYPGSSIGNFSPDEAAVLLGRFHQLAGTGGQLLIGFDLKKDPELLHLAYNDAAGMTAAFNLNLLERLNRELAADFDPARFRPLRFLQSGRRAHRDASGQPRRADGKRGGPAFPFRPGRDPAHRELVQVPLRGIQRDCPKRGLAF